MQSASIGMKVGQIFDEEMRSEMKERMEDRMRGREKEREREAETVRERGAGGRVCVLYSSFEK